MNERLEEISQVFVNLKGQHDIALTTHIIKLAEGHLERIMNLSFKF